MANVINSSKNSSSCNIRVNKPTRIYMDTSVLLNDLSLDKSFQVIGYNQNNNNSMSATYRNNKKDLNKSFSTKKNNLLSLKLNNNNNNRKKSEMVKIKNNPIEMKNLKESVRQIKEKLFHFKNVNLNETRNNAQKNNTQGNLAFDRMYSSMEDEYRKNNNSIISATQNKSLMHLNTSNNNISLKRENSENNEEEKIRVNSIDKIGYSEFNFSENNPKNRKKINLNFDKISVITAKNKKISSPIHNNFEDFKQGILGEEYIENQHKLDKGNKLKTSINELSLENQKLMDEINKLKINKDEEVYKKISRLEGQVILLSRKNAELIQKLNESVEGKKKLLNVIKGNEKKMNEYNDIVQKNNELEKVIKNYERKCNNDNNKIQDLSRNNKLLENKNKDLNKKLKNSLGKINELGGLVKNNDSNNEIKNLENKINELNSSNKRSETEKKEFIEKIKELN